MIANISLQSRRMAEPRPRLPEAGPGASSRATVDAFLPAASTDIPLPRSAAWLQSASGMGRLDGAAGPTASSLQCAATIPPSGSGTAPSVFGRQLELNSLGDHLWALPFYTQTTPCVDGEGFVYVGEVDGTVCRLDGSTGQKVKEFKAPRRTFSLTMTSVPARPQNLPPKITRPPEPVQESGRDQARRPCRKATRRGDVSDPSQPRDEVDQVLALRGAIPDDVVVLQVRQPPGDEKWTFDRAPSKGRRGHPPRLGGRRQAQECHVQVVGRTQGLRVAGTGGFR